MKNAIPIHLHLQKASEDNRAEFSPFSLHMTGNVKDSLHVQSSHDQTHFHSRGGVEEDGTCTIRAESHLEAKEILSHQHTLQQPNTNLNLSREQTAVNTGVATSSKHQNRLLGKTESSITNTNKPTKIFLLAPRNSQHKRQQVSKKYTQGSFVNDLADVIETEVSPNHPHLRGNRPVNTADQTLREKAAVNKGVAATKGAGRGDSFGDIADG